MASTLVILAMMAMMIRCAKAEALKATGATTTLSGIHYWIPPDVVSTINDSLAFEKLRDDLVASGGFIPLTVVHLDSGENTTEILSQSFARYKSQDDVWQDSFSKVTYVQTKPGENVNNSSLENLGDNRILLRDPGHLNGQQIPEGPYFFSSIGLHRAYRLYPDHQMAFSESMYTNSDGQHSVLPANIPGQSLAIAVPSRLYYKQTAAQPLAGIRLGVKDIFDISSVKTGNGNRAWYNFYPAANSTALPVQRLIDAGAIVVGKMKTAQFANGEYANSDWIDYQSPFNPRGDGYQDPNFSSAGPGAGIASYPWLDVALGSDTGGSIRGPARVQGLYALRPSHGLVSLTHTTPLAPEFDTAALIVRNPSLLRSSASAMYNNMNRNTSKHYPTQILMPDIPANLSTETISAIDKFIDGLKTFLGVQNTTNFDINASWKETKPQTSADTLNSLLNTTYPIVIAQRQTKLVRDPFFADYAIKYDGRRPFINPVPLVRWGYGDSLPETASEDGIRNKTLFMNWFQKNVLVPDFETCSNSILVYISSPLVTYRNTYRSPPVVPFGFTSGYWSVMSEAPDLVLTVGQMSYFSDVTNHTEYIPVTVNVMAAKGCDLMLLDLAVDLVSAGILHNVTTGASAIDGGEILF